MGYWKWWYHRHQENMNDWITILISYIAVSVVVTVCLQPRILWWIQCNLWITIGIFYVLLIFPALGIYLIIKIPHMSWKAYRKSLEKK